MLSKLTRNDRWLAHLSRPTASSNRKLRSKHDGEIKGQRLFQCAPGHGAIVRPTHVTVGDFPEEEIDWDDLGSDGEL